jgi:hypothetical protein
MQGCFNKTEIIAGNGIKSIAVTLDSASQKVTSGRIEISNKDSLTQIIKRLNICESEPIKFYPTHKLDLLYNNGQEKIIFCSGSSMKCEGRTYRLNESIRDILGY